MTGGGVRSTGAPDIRSLYPLCLSNEMHRNGYIDGYAPCYLTMSSRPPSERVIDAVAETTERDPTELPPLYDTLDPDALDALLRTGFDGTVSFTFAGCSVTVGDDGEIRVEEAAPA